MATRDQAQHIARVDFRALPADPGVPRPALDGIYAANLTVSNTMPEIGPATRDANPCYVGEQSR